MSEAVSLLPHIPSWCARDNLNLPLPVTNPKTKEKRNKLHIQTYTAVYIHNSSKVKKITTLSHVRMEDMSLLASSIAIM